MNAFDPRDDLVRDVAYRLLANSPVTLFHRRRHLDETTAWLVGHGYQVIELDASRWSDPAAMHRAVADALDFPEYYGGNLDALNDCLRDVVDHDYAWKPGATGFVLVFTRYDAFTASCPDAAQAVLDILADRSRGAALVGGRMLCLVQSDDPGIQFEKVGAAPVVWNDAEWLNSTRFG